MNDYALARSDTFADLLVRRGIVKSKYRGSVVTALTQVLYSRHKFDVRYWDQLFFNASDTVLVDSLRGLLLTTDTSPAGTVGKSAVNAIVRIGQLRPNDTPALLALAAAKWPSLQETIAKLQRAATPVR
jgi:hypothetical protein